MAKPKDYYFSTPVMPQEEPGFEAGARPTVVMTSKDIWDRSQRLDANNSYRELHRLLKVPPVMAEAKENYFQPQLPMTCQELKTHLENRGFIHNPGLDGFMEDYLRLSR